MHVGIKMLKFTALFVVLISSPCSATHAVDAAEPLRHAPLGFGKITCADWIESRSRDATHYGNIYAWIMGYFSAFNEYDKRQKMKLWQWTGYAKPHLLVIRGHKN